MAKSPHPREFGEEHLRALSVGKRMYPKMDAGFENDAERRDYLRRVRANDNNVAGMPSIAMFPPDEIVDFVPSKAAKECKVLGCGGCCVYRDSYVCPRCKTSNA